MITPQQVASRLEEAANTLLRARLADYSTIPDIVRSSMEACGNLASVVTFGPPPTREEVARMDEAIAWLRWLDQEQVKLVWLRATLIPWKLIEVRLACDRSTAWRKWTVAINRISSRLAS
jgi:hypothetical protein